MSAVTRICLGMLILTLVSIAQAVDSPRQVVDLNSGWKFIRQEVPSAEQNVFDDTQWTSVNLPHTWNNLDGQDGGNNYYRGIGWYRLHLKTEPGWAGKSLYLKFDAASLEATVYVNGKRAGTHQGGFSAFCFDITSLVNPTGDNVIGVEVTNAHNAEVAPLSADFTFFGGLYRSVHLLVLNPLCISPTDDASSGVYAKQEKIDTDRALLLVTTVLQHIANTNPTIKCDLVDAGGIVVSTKTSSNRLLPIGQAVPWTIPMTLDHPHLWNARKDPYEYTLRVSVLDKETITDQVEQPVGLRFFRVDPEKGFFLNGQPYRLYGVNRHQDHLDKGWAISLEDHQLDFTNIMEMGCTGIRLSHYQHAQEFYDLCDKGGMIAWAEIPLVNKVTDSPAFDANAASQLRELIKQNFNHPSICFWGLSNELTVGSKDAGQVAQNKHQEDLIAKLNAEARELDETRPTTQASARAAGEKIDSITDVLGFNRYFGWYSGKATDWPRELDKLHKMYPQRSLAISEYGGGAAVTQHEMNAKQPKANSKWHPEEWQATVHENAWAAIQKRDWIWGSFLWCEHDFASDGRNEGDHPGMNDKGLITYDGKTRKDTFYFYKANWSTEPVIYITQRRYTPRPMTDGPVKIYSNCDSVELSINGKSLGSKPGNDIRIFLFDKVQLQPGDNKVEAKGVRDGKQITDTISISVEPNPQ